MALTSIARALHVIKRSPWKSAYSSAISNTWADAGPLYTEHAVFSGRGLEDEPPGHPKLAVVLHGLLGAGRNLRSVATQLLQEVVRHSGSTWTMVLVDLRNHGKSSRRAGLDPPHTLEATARDVIKTVAHSWPGGDIDALVGHSMGGKVCLELVRQMVEQQHASTDDAPSVFLKKTPKQVWVLDAAPGRVEAPTLGVSADVLRVLQAVGKVPLPISSREWLYDHLEQQGFGKGLQQWLGSNLVMEGKQQYTWSFDLDGASSMFRSYMNSEYWDLLRSPPQRTTLNIVRAERSDRWDETSRRQLEEAAAASIINSRRGDVQLGETRIHVLPDAGHWLHTDNPRGLIELMAPSLR